jgi:cobalt-zinc-cadmium efflux system protein
MAEQHAHSGGHDHAHDHGHGHGHHHHHRAPDDFSRSFAIGIALNLGFVGIEIIYGLVADSLALLADAGHNFGDVIGLILAWAAAWAVKRAPSTRRTYGFRRSSILASLTNAVILLVSVGGIAVEALRRLADPAPVETGIVMWVAAAGILVNGVTAVLFMGGKQRDINIKGAFLHMLSDALVSAGVVLAGFMIAWTGWVRLDPLASLVIAVIITLGTWDLLRQSLDMALDAVPAGIDPAEVRAYLAGLPGVVEVHDLHIWAMSTTETALTAHLVRPGGGLDDALIARACAVLRDRFAIAHTTIQIEHGAREHPCHIQNDPSISPSGQRPATNQRSLSQNG